MFLSDVDIVDICNESYSEGSIKVHVVDDLVPSFRVLFQEQDVALPVCVVILVVGPFHSTPNHIVKGPSTLQLSELGAAHRRVLLGSDALPAVVVIRHSDQL
jgi:hypothetical protein